MPERLSDLLSQFVTGGGLICAGCFLRGLGVPFPSVGHFIQAGMALWILGALLSQVSSSRV